MATSLPARLERIARPWTLRLTHYGRKTGTPYVVTIWFVVDGEAVYLQTMDMRRQWPRNVRKRPDVVLQVGDETLRGQATPITDPSEMEHVARLATRKYHDRATTRVASTFVGCSPGVR
jgi:deazaflavin-dependent oxidoreductase (nitroreductase family)